MFLVFIVLYFFFGKSIYCALGVIYDNQPIYNTRTNNNWQLINQIIESLLVTFNLSAGTGGLNLDLHEAS